MAPLTWKNVDAPNFGNSVEAYLGAGQGIAKAFEGLGSTLTGVRDIQRNNRSAEAIPMLAKISSEQGANAAIDWASKNIAPQDMTPGLQEAMLGATRKGMDFDVDRNDMRLRNTEDGRTQTTFDRNVTRENQMADLTDPYIRSKESAYWGPAGGEAASGGGGLPPLSEREWMARNIRAEAGGESVDGKRAVAAVTMNRAKDGGYGDGITGVITKPGQFSWLNSVTGYAGGEGGIDINKVQPTEEDYAVADEYLGGVASGKGYYDPTGGATHYYNPNSATPAWGSQAGGQWATIGNHTFGSPDGPGKNGEIRLSDYIPKEGNLLRPSDLAELTDDMNTTQRTAKGQRDADRSEAEDLLAKEVAQSITMTTPRTEDMVPEVMNNPDLSPTVKDKIIADLGARNTEAARALPIASQVATSLTPELNAAVTASENSFNAFTAVTDFEASQNQAERVVSNAQSTYSNKDSIGAVAKTLGFVDDPDATGYLASYAKQVQDGLRGKDGNVPSPALVASLLEETARRGGWIPGEIFDGDVDKLLPNVDDAIELGKALKMDSTEGVRLVSQKVTVRDQKVRTMQGLRAQQSELMTIIQRMEHNKQDSTAMKAQLAAVTGQINAMAPGSKEDIPEVTSADAPWTPLKAEN